jgi:hypothetical protein
MRGLGPLSNRRDLFQEYSAATAFVVFCLQAASRGIQRGSCGERSARSL